ncbi:hypothetical protein JAAARDRAFT_210588 [Jaapia argillacea MUCL 33604]|uniref:Protein kinase domain-containing protein n=1 Tax=Jaapia argillacea MUCL 33604 TaxID=933084 RepID=A0A067PC23_9AGAM|nr:hypothetical protein JAAARDRAFT_210588 [Jaapia argillacea MUCL 33604]
MEQHRFPETAKIYQSLTLLIIESVSRRSPVLDENHGRFLEILAEQSEEMSKQDVIVTLAKSRRYRTQLLALARQFHIDVKELEDAIQTDEFCLSAYVLILVISRHKRDLICGLRGEEAQSFLDLIVLALEGPTFHDIRSRKSAYRLLIKLSSASNRLPSALFVRGIELTTNTPVCGGGFADIFRGVYTSRTSQDVAQSVNVPATQVAIKRLRVFQSTKQQIVTYRKFCQEAIVWQQLGNHPNILPFIGVDANTFAPLLCMVSPWMAHGNALVYLEDRRSDPSTVDRLLIEIAEGLRYLHRQSLVHGDLRGANILIDDDEHARLADFGLVGLADTSAMTHSTKRDGSVRWMAPELLSPDSFCGVVEGFQRTFASDIYAFGCVCLELHTGRPPYSEIASDIVAVLAILRGDQPRRPATTAAPMMSDAVWELARACWGHLPQSRPKVREVSRVLKDLMSSVDPTCF